MEEDDGGLRLLLMLEYRATRNLLLLGNETADMGRYMLVESIRNRLRFVDTKNVGMLFEIEQ